MERKLDGVQAAMAGGVGREVRVGEREAKKVFVLLKRLEGGPKQRKAALGTVFRLTVLEGHSQAKTARLCECVPALISRRVKTIESRFGMSIKQLRNFASVILEMEASVKGDRYGKRKRGAPADEPARYGDGLERPDLVEDASGYLPEEKPDYGG
jgi:ribosomal protein L14